MDPETIWQCAADIHEEWYEGNRASLERLVAELSKRREIIGKLIDEFRRSSRNPFPNWKHSATPVSFLSEGEAFEIR
jgi:hypothetical protein